MRSASTGTALPDGSKLVHIGMPKTGTTALQAALDAGRPQLREAGVRLVGKGRHEMKTALAAAGTLPPYWVDRREKRWEQLAENFRTSQARCTIWSSETLSQAAPDRIRHIADRLGSDTHVVLTLRPLAPLLASQWQEVLRRRGTEDLDTWLHRHFDAVSPDGTVNVEWTRHMPELHRFSLRRVVEEWGSVFGEERLTFVVADPHDRSSGMRVFESLLGVPVGTLVPQEQVNASTPYPESEMLRAFNIAFTENGGDHPTWMFTAGKGGKLALRELQNLSSHPIRTPRWAADRSNEYTRDWIAAVEASDATVIGDLQHLLVDPADYPEDVTPPDTVSVASAGRVAEVLFRSALEYVPAPDPQAAAPERPERGLESYDARELLRELARRGRRRIGRRG
ncbi:hypothetical protein [Nocardioides sp. W7]|uniref:hypothetical protein n=1 Tax=Nocardioides sp. W7 TaxID=2931390 RepID=UPI001FD451C3|nr:hypothetical protein [Nocardioides sp. W7]